MSDLLTLGYSPIKLSKFLWATTYPAMGPCRITVTSEPRIVE